MSSFEFNELESQVMDTDKDYDEVEKIYEIIDDQEETDYEDMISNNLVQFEYEIFNQIR